MSNFEIDHGVPLPAPEQRGGRPSKYPWADMEVGDSFFVPGVKLSNFSGTVSARAKRTGEKYAQRTVEENGVNGVRIWRVE